MIAPNENKHSRITIAIVTISIIAITIPIGLAIYDSVIGPPYYAAPGSNTETFGAPDGTYLQKEWGSFDNQTREWSFAMCDHDYLGPLHGTWQVKNGTWIPVLDQVGVYPIDARLYITIKNNMIVDVSVHSLREYGN